MASQETNMSKNGTSDFASIPQINGRDSFSDGSEDTVSKKGIVMGLKVLILRYVRFMKDVLAHLHSSSEAEHKSKGGLLPDVSVSQSPPVLKLFASEDQSLLVRGIPVTEQGAFDDRHCLQDSVSCVQWL